MKPFNLELAKQGHPVVTRTGKPVRIICTDAKMEDPIISLVFNGAEESVRAHRNDGRYLGSEDSNFDIFMAPVKKEGWINVYVDYSVGGKIFPTKKAAFDWSIIQGYCGIWLDTIKIEWEE